MSSIKCYHCKGIHTSVVAVKECASKGKPVAVAVATLSLDDILGTDVNPDPKAELDKWQAEQNKASEDFTAMLDELAGIVEAPAPVVVKTGQDLDLGMYQMAHPVTGKMTVFKVKMNKAGTHKMAEALVITEGKYTNSGKPSGKFKYAFGMMAKLTSDHKMTEAQAKEFHDATKEKYGVDFGFCCVCGKLLTVKKSIDKGIGPVCETKF